MIQFNDLGQQWNSIKNKCMPQILEVLQTGRFINGPHVQKFEQNFAEYIGTKYAVGVNSGTDALTLSIISALDIFIEPRKVGLIIAQNNTYIATLLSIYHANNGKNFDIGLVDCDMFNQMSMSELNNLLNKYRNSYDYCIIIPAHLYGYCADMKRLEHLAQHYKCMIIEDASQAHGTRGYNKRTGAYGLVNAFSLYPGKNLGACGDAGIITTDNQDVYKYLLCLRNQGSQHKYQHDTLGFNSRLDEIQAIILNEKIHFLDIWNYRRNIIAEQYKYYLDKVTTPNKPYYCPTCSYHIYNIVVYDRNGLRKHLNQYEIPTIIHYPTTVIKQQCCKDFNFVTISDMSQSKFVSNYTLSLPIHPYLQLSEVKFICEKINEYI